MRPDDRRAQLLRQINKVLDRKKLVEPKPKKEKEQKEYLIPAAKLAYKVGKYVAPKVGQAVTKINPAAAGMASAVVNKSVNYAKDKLDSIMQKRRERQKKMGLKLPTEMVTTGGVGLPVPDKGPINMTDRRRRKDKPPVLLKRFRQYSGY